MDDILLIYYDMNLVNVVQLFHHEWIFQLILDKKIISIPPNQSMDVNVKIETQKDQTTGIYDGFIKFEGEHHTEKVPVS